MLDTPPVRPSIAPLDEETLDALLRDEVRIRARDELPLLRRPVDAVRESFRATGLLGSTDAVYRVDAGDERYVAEVYTPDLPVVPTTIRIGLAPLEVSARTAAVALGAVVDHLFATTAVVRVERAVPVDDGPARAACASAGLALEGTRRRAAVRANVLVDVALFRADRLSRPPSWERPALSRIGIVTGGGDAPGLNAVIRAVVKTAAIEHGW
jgi:hypothetical protein